MHLHVLDTAAPRLLEMRAVYVFQTRLDPCRLQHTFEQLLVGWPFLRERLNAVRTCTLPATNPAPWKTKFIDAPLSEHVPLAALERQQLDHAERRQLEEHLFHSMPPSKLAPSPPVLQMQAVHFQDGCVLRFVVQHAFCDGSGLIRIICAFAAIFRGETIAPVGAGRPTKIEFKSAAGKAGNQVAPDPAAEQLFAASCRQWGAGVPGMMLYGVQQWIPGRQCQRPVCTVHIAGSLVETLCAQAAAGVGAGAGAGAQHQHMNLSPNDLLMAMIALAAEKAFPHEVPAMAFMANFNSQLVHPAAFHNPWWPVALPMPKPPSTNTNPHTAPCTTTRLFELATQVRQTVLTSRRPRFEALGPWRPLYPAYLARSGSGSGGGSSILVSSSAHLDVYDISFGQGVKPLHAGFSVPMIQPLAAMGIRNHDMVLLVRDRNGTGYCISGSLHARVWRELESLCAGDWEAGSSDQREMWKEVARL